MMRMSITGTGTPAMPSRAKRSSSLALSNSGLMNESVPSGLISVIPQPGLTAAPWRA